MKVIVAKTAGFCNGVRNALEVTLEAIRKRQDGERICTYGPLIHNRQVLAMIEEKGIRTEETVEGCAGKKTIIRAHGIPPNERHALRGEGSTILDATCKKVAKVHSVIKRHARQGYHTVIVGDDDHAEVIGLMGYTQGMGIVINRPEQVDELPSDWKDVLMVAQTTQNEEIFKEIQARFVERFPNGKVKNTICDSTHERQVEVRRLCSQVDAMVIVGGVHSGNTVRLAEVAQECGVPTYHVETEAGLNAQEMARYASVGVSAGASTPNWIIRSVVQFLESIRPENDSSSKNSWRGTLELLVYGNVFIALGAALLSLVVHALTDLSGTFAVSVMAACYAFAMHSLNIYIDRDAIQMNDPRRAAFYQSYRRSFTQAGIGALVVALVMAASIGVPTLLSMLVLVVMGSLYAVPLILPAWWENLSVFKLKDIPTSKTFSVPVAWASVIVLLPHLSEAGDALGSMVYGFWVVFLMVLVRTTLLDLMAVQGDRLVGKETLVVLIGEERTARFIRTVLILLGSSLFIGPLVGLSTTFALIMLPAVGLYAYFLGMCFKNRLKEDPMFEAIIESVPIGLGLLALILGF